MFPVWSVVLWGLVTCHGHHEGHVILDDEDFHEETDELVDCFAKSMFIEMSREAVNHQWDDLASHYAEDACLFFPTFKPPDHLCGAETIQEYYESFGDESLMWDMDGDQRVGGDPSTGSPIASWNSIHQLWAGYDLGSFDVVTVWFPDGAYDWLIRWEIQGKADFAFDDTVYATSDETKSELVEVADALSDAIATGSFREVAEYYTEDGCLLYAQRGATDGNCGRKAIETSYQSFGSSTVTKVGKAFLHGPRGDSPDSVLWTEFCLDAGHSGCFQSVRVFSKVNGSWLITFEVQKGVPMRIHSEFDARQFRITAAFFSTTSSAISVVLGCAMCGCALFVAFRVHRSRHPANVAIVLLESGVE